MKPVRGQVVLIMGEVLGPASGGRIELQVLKLYMLVLEFDAFSRAPLARAAAWRCEPLEDTRRWVELQQVRPSNASERSFKVHSPGRVLRNF